MADFLECFLLGTLVNMHCSLAWEVTMDYKNLRGQKIVDRRSVEYYGLTNEKRIELINAHNYYRSKVHPKASSMLKMYWSAEAEDAAQLWANKCLLRHGFPDLSNKTYKYMGQNIVATRNPLNVSYTMALLVSEAKDYNVETNLCTDDISLCVHYKQIVWAESYLLGCGLKACPKLKGDVLVCNYFPHGNDVGQKAYNTSSASCSGCGAGVPCKDNLCDAGQSKCTEETQCSVINHQYCLCGERVQSLANRFLSNCLFVLYLLFVPIII